MDTKTLNCAQKNKVYVIKDVLISNTALLRELDNFGLKKGSAVSVVASNFGKKSYLINIDRGYFAIDKSICEKILIDE